MQHVHHGTTNQYIKNTKDIYPDYLNFKSSIRCWEYSSKFDLQVDNVITEF
jgi:hypothetical protein